MPKRSSYLLAVVAVALLTTSAVSVTRADAALLPAPPTTVDSWAWCCVNPDDAAAPATVKAMALAAGIDATFGPCNIPEAGYTPVDPKNRYVPPDVYERLVRLNASVGMKTVVFDARLWSHDAAVRNAAITFWQPLLPNIAAWDLGDEYNPDPDAHQWEVLVDRWNTILGDATARTGIRPFANFLPNTDSLNLALADLDGVEQLLSFAQYGGDKGAGLATAYATRARLMCGVNAFDHMGFVPTEATIRADGAALIGAGCDQLLVFGGYPVYDDPTHVFGISSIVDRDGRPTPWAPAATEATGHSSLLPWGPARLLETRVGLGLGTVDGGFDGVGQLPGDSVLTLGVLDRAGIPTWAKSVVLNVTVTEATEPGYLTVYPCGANRPTASNVNYVKGTTKAVGVIAQIGRDGAVCVYSQRPTHLVVDVTGIYPEYAGFSAIPPARVLDSRAGAEFPTVDGQLAGIGRRPAGITEIPVAGRGGVPADAKAVAVSLTAVAPTADGFLTAYPCGGPPPNASAVNFSAGSITPNAAIVQVGVSGSICVLSNTDTDLVVDVTGYDARWTVARTFEPQRILDTRPGFTTADQLAAGQGLRPGDAVLELAVGGRLGIPTGIRAAVLNVTVTEPQSDGFVTVYPCGASRPATSSLNYLKGQTVSNLVVVGVSSAESEVCIYTQRATHLVVDVSGYHT